ncbi:MAG: TerC family protein [Polyangiales bacterium]
MAMTTDPFLVFSSNIFAILGLRSLYFVLADALARFHHLKPSLAAILVFVAAKMLLHDVYSIPTSVSLLFVAGTLALVLIISCKKGLLSHAS